MTWEPTVEEVAAYSDAAREAAAATPEAFTGRARRIVEFGLRAAYAKLEDRLFRGDPTVLGPPMQITRIPPPLMQYAEADNLDAADRAAADGWRILHVYGPRDAPRYVLERERPDPPEQP